MGQSSHKSLKRESILIALLSVTSFEEKNGNFKKNLNQGLVFIVAEKWSYLPVITWSWCVDYLCTFIKKHFFKVMRVQNIFLWRVSPFQVIATVHSLLTHQLFRKTKKFFHCYFCFSYSNNALHFTQGFSKKHSIYQIFLSYRIIYLGNLWAEKKIFLSLWLNLKR